MCSYRSNGLSLGRALFAVSSCAASPATVGVSNRLPMPSSAPIVSRTRLIRRPAKSECPPNSKNPSSIPTRARPRTSANRSHNISSCGVRVSVRQDSGKIRCRQSAAIELLIRRQRQFFQLYKRARHHIIRQAFAYIFTKSTDIKGLIRDSISRQPLISRLVFTDTNTAKYPGISTALTQFLLILSGTRGF